VKRYCYLSGLLLNLLFISTSCSFLTLDVKERSPATEQSTVALLWLWLVARFYATEKRRRIPGWQLEDVALLKIIKDNATPPLEPPPPRQQDNQAGGLRRTKLLNPLEKILLTQFAPPAAARMRS